ncbi:MAG TPA: LysR family transcriptional regulator [Paenirhodobacter sp.]
MKQIDTFVRLAALCSFRRVAEQMNTTQPNISNRISQMEEMLGMRLFERDAGSVVLTEQGRQMLPLAERVLSAVWAFTDAGQNKKFSTTIRLGAVEMVAHSWLQDFLRVMHEKFPYVVVELDVDRTANLQRALLARTLDIAFLNGPVPDFNVANIELGEVSMAWVAAPELAANLPTHLQAEDLAPYPILTHAKDTRPHVEVVQFFRQADCLETRIAPVNDMTSCLQMTMNGLGIAVLPRPFVDPAVASGRLALLDVDWLPAKLNFTASYPHSPASLAVTSAASLAKSMARWVSLPVQWWVAPGSAADSHPGSIPDQSSI